MEKKRAPAGQEMRAHGADDTSFDNADDAGCGGAGGVSCGSAPTGQLRQLGAAWPENHQRGGRRVDRVPGKSRA